MVMTRMYSVVGMICGHLIFQKACSLVALSTSAASTKDWSTLPRAETYRTNGLADGGGEQDQDDAAQGVSGVAQPVDVLVKDAHGFCQVVEDAVVVVEHPLPHDGDGDGAGDGRADRR